MKENVCVLGDTLLTEENPYTSQLKTRRYTISKMYYDAQLVALGIDDEETRGISKRNPDQA